MPEILSLYELNQLIRSTIEESLSRPFLVTAEIASCDVKNHCYLTLVDKEEDVIRAEIRAVIWANRYRVIAPDFEQSTGTKLSKGIKVLFQATVDFHERYGLKLTIHSIDPSYTIGELAVRRKEILERLAREDLLHRNKELEFPLVPQRIGIISSATAAGYEDLMNHLQGNPYGYKFTCTLYEAFMQGDRAESSILGALRQCSRDADLLDVVVIVRGGGGQTDLHCFDSYEIGRAVALLPLPVISGIGHQRDITVVDEVSHMRAKTPTAAADMIIHCTKNFQDRIDSLLRVVIEGTRRLAADAKERLVALARRLEVSARDEVMNNIHVLSVSFKGLSYSLKFIQNEKERLRAWGRNVDHLSPLNVMKRGYSITYNKGMPVKSVSDAEAGDKLRTFLHDGEVLSTAEKTIKGRKNKAMQKGRTDIPPA